MGYAKSAKGVAVAITLTAAAIGLWGFAHRLYATLLPGLGSAFAMTPDQSQLARPAIVIGYLVMALPAAFISRNLGYKIGVLFGLGAFAVGMFLVFPAVQQHSLAFFLISAGVVGSGLAILEVTAEPLIVFIGSEHFAIQRTVLADSLSPLGGLLALYLGPVILAHAADTGTLVTLFSAVGVASIALAFVIELTPFPPVAAERVPAGDSTLKSFLPPLRLKRFRYAVSAGFLILFAQITMAGFGPLYARIAVPSLTPAASQDVQIWSYAALGAARLIAPLLMKWIAPMRLVVAFAVAAALSALVSALSSGPIAIAGILGACFFTSILFPSIFADTLLRIGDMAKSGTAIMMFVAFSSSGIISLFAIIYTPVILSWIMFVPAICFAGVVPLSLALLRLNTAAANT